MYICAASAAYTTNGINPATDPVTRPVATDPAGPVVPSAGVDPADPTSAGADPTNTPAPTAKPWKLLHKLAHGHFHRGHRMHREEETKRSRPERSDPSASCRHGKGHEKCLAAYRASQTPAPAAPIPATDPAATATVDVAA